MGPVLQALHFNKPFSLATDASDNGIGSVLLQEDPNGEFHAVSYHSKKKLNGHQKRYSTIEKEALALINSLKHFEIYLTVSASPITVYTD